jgi:hypothetical protein
MQLNLVKLCVGTASVEDLEAWQQAHRTFKHRATRKECVFHTTFQTPKRVEELLDGGSLYWVIKGLIQVRQRLVAFEEGTKDDGTACCRIVLDKELVTVRPVPRRAFQGWRYLSADDAPADFSGSTNASLASMPFEMRRELAELCLI